VSCTRRRCACSNHGSGGPGACLEWCEEHDAQNRGTTMTPSYRVQGARHVALRVRPRRAAVRQVSVASTLAIAFTVLIGACSPAQNGAVDGADVPGSVVSADARVTMQRQPCFGTCPVYSVDIDAAGVVTFRGERFV